MASAKASFSGTENSTNMKVTRIDCANFGSAVNMRM